MTKKGTTSSSDDQPAVEQTPGALARVDTSGILPQAEGNFGEVADIMRANLAGEQLTPFDLERVRVPAGGGTYWTVVTPEKPQGAPHEALVGTIVHQRLARQYWSTPFGEGDDPGGPPDCYSDDSVVGHGNPGGSCAECPFAQWNSDPKGGKGQACAQARLLFLVSPESFLPRILVVPRSSLKAIRKYMTTLASLGRPYWTVVSRFKLEATRNAGNILYSRIVPELAQVLSPEVASKIRDYANELRPVFEAVRIEREEVDGDAADAGV